jgi:trehalose 6-phosphate synthase/phosphatase
LDQWFGNIPGLGMSAEHGCFLKDAHAKEWSNLMEEMDLGWKSEVIEIFNYYTERTPGSFLELKMYSVTWHYRLADPDFGYFNWRVLIIVLFKPRNAKTTSRMLCFQNSQSRS